MSYTVNRFFADADFEDVDGKVRSALADKGFGVLTEIDVKATMKKIEESTAKCGAVAGGRR